MSSIDVAIADVDAFEAIPGPVSWNLDRSKTLQRLRMLLRNPDLINQLGLNVCGPAVFFRIWLARDPVAVAHFACSLLRDGAAPLGNLYIQPRNDLLQQDYAAVSAAVNAAQYNTMPDTADWMLLCALRDSENVIPYLGDPRALTEQIAGVTLPNTLVSWLQATNLYTSIQNDTNIVLNGDRQKLLNLIPTSDVDIVVFINARVIPPYPDLQQVAVPPLSIFAIPNHYIRMSAPFILKWDDPAWINMEFWTWGKEYRGWQGTEFFFSNYFGTVIAQT